MSMFSEIFRNPADFYNRLAPDQQAAATQSFQQQFQRSPDPQAQQYAQMDPSMIGPQQLAEMHQYAQRSDPGMLNRIMSHPVLDGALVAFGVHEFRKHEQRI